MSPRGDSREGIRRLLRVIVPSRKYALDEPIKLGKVVTGERVAMWRSPTRASGAVGDRVARESAYCGIDWPIGQRIAAGYRDVIANLEPALLAELEGIVSDPGRRVDETLAINARSGGMPDWREPAFVAVTPAQGWIDMPSADCFWQTNGAAFD